MGIPELTEYSVPSWAKVHFHYKRGWWHIYYDREGVNHQVPVVMGRTLTEAKKSFLEYKGPDYYKTYRVNSDET